MKRRVRVRPSSLPACDKMAHAANAIPPPPSGPFTALTTSCVNYKLNPFDEVAVEEALSSPTC
jgi:hypothetical protein